MDSTRLATYRTNLDFYQGSQWQQQSRHRQLVFNYAKVSIDKVTSFLMRGLNFACYPEEGTDELKARARRTDAILRQMSLRAERGNLIIPANFSQELIDVVEVTDTRCAIDQEKCRVQAIHTDYDRRHGIYTQRLGLCAP
jgi:hypothetical protein